MPTSTEAVSLISCYFFLFGSFSVFHLPPAFWDYHLNILHFTFIFHLVTFPMVKQEYSMAFRKPFKNGPASR